jgi:hypothetical protein
VSDPEWVSGSVGAHFVHDPKVVAIEELEIVEGAIRSASLDLPRTILDWCMSAQSDWPLKNFLYFGGFSEVPNEYLKQAFDEFSGMVRSNAGALFRL